MAGDPRMKVSGEADLAVVERRELPSSPLPPTPLRYMGTKRSLGPVVRDELLRVGKGRTADLFCGMGSVAAGLAGKRPVLANDTALFAACFARARFLDYEHPDVKEAIKQILPFFTEAETSLRRRYANRLKSEAKAVNGSTTALREVMETSPHVGNSRSVRNSARDAKELADITDYRLATIYFSAAYFSTRQAIEIDALRYAIDMVAPSKGARDWLLSAWMSAAGSLINAPGHAAQFLKPTSASVAGRIKRQWSRSMWGTFVERLEEIVPLGSRRWREGNLVTSCDALDLIQTDLLADVTAVYADPPYTVDHYSRFYHVYETLYLYDFPDSIGMGRYRDGRFFTPFSRVGEVTGAFEQLISGLASQDMPLVLSYPSSGVLNRAGVDLRTLLSESYPTVREIEIAMTHSTLGASTGVHTKNAMEKVYVCKP